VLRYRQPSPAQLKGRPLALRVQSLLLGVAPLPTKSARHRAGDAGAAPGAAPLPRAAVAAAASKAATMEPTNLGAYMGSAVTQARGRSMRCQPDVDCDSEWGLEANAVVLLVGIDGSSGFFCTGRLGDH
jgi:hypothetical protein